MGQRHNRRRTRRSSNRNNTSPTSAIQTPQRSSYEPHYVGNSPTACSSRGSPAVTLAPSWHYGYTAWQTRERPLRMGSDGLDECSRICGGEPGDDLSLCYRMLEYFAGLDYIESLVSN
ncbi:hypothetical protein N7535_000260 [Penicillium sp. DV-2018c]|nr:hypothetical protein N7461_006497 [Penicillium sp. DV-2018c]KAJ5581640.1 hypothetical protein N7535_000260 [Penicillium sp. DV-2018c]